MSAREALRRQPALGARADASGTRFRIWAPGAKSVRVRIEPGRAPGRSVPLDRGDGDVFEGVLPDARPGDRYRFLLDGRGPYPDPASRYQPEGLHGPSEIVDPGAFRWSDSGWAGLPLERAILYELHVGTFTPSGTFEGAAERLPYLRDLGVTAVELMPIADFPGDRNWGYDGAAPFAPARCYGSPDDLRRLVDRAHSLGLAVLLDVVYNHFGPDGAYAPVLSPAFFSDRHESPWGRGINFDGPGAEGVRSYFIQNALAWLTEYHMDGLRLDATHAIVDDSPRHFLSELSAAVREEIGGRSVLLIAEDVRNLASLALAPSRGGSGLDALWSDDFHHVLRRLLTGDHEAYYRDFEGTTAELARTLRQGWLYAGERSEYFGGPRGTDPRGLAPPRFVFFLQNHDQIGNRALGDRFHAAVDAATLRAATALLLSAPQTPLLFMGQEWAASAPFLYFTDHAEALGRAVTEGRRREFRHFAAFSEPSARERIPDPQAAATFTRSRLDWSESAREPHATVLALHRALLRLRATEPAWSWGDRSRFDVQARDEGSLVLRRESERGALVTAIRLKGTGAVVLPRAPLPALRPDGGVPDDILVLSTESEEFATDPSPPRLRVTAEGLEVRFARPGAVVIRA